MGVQGSPRSSQLSPAPPPPAARDLGPRDGPLLSTFLPMLWRRARRNLGTQQPPACLRVGQPAGTHRPLWTWDLKSFLRFYESMYAYH